MSKDTSCTDSGRPVKSSDRHGFSSESYVFVSGNDLKKQLQVSTNQSNDCQIFRVSKNQDSIDSKRACKLFVDTINSVTDSTELSADDWASFIVEYVMSPRMPADQLIILMSGTLQNIGSTSHSRALNPAYYSFASALSARTQDVSTPRLFEPIKKYLDNGSGNISSLKAKEIINAIENNDIRKACNKLLRTGISQD